MGFESISPIPETVRSGTKPQTEAVPVSETLKSAAKPLEMTPVVNRDAANKITGAENPPASDVRPKQQLVAEISGPGSVPEGFAPKVVKREAEPASTNAVPAPQVVYEVSAMGTVPTKGDENLPPYAPSSLEDAEGHEKAA